MFGMRQRQDRKLVETGYFICGMPKSMQTLLESVGEKSEHRFRHRGQCSIAPARREVLPGCGESENGIRRSRQLQRYRAPMKAAGYIDAPPRLREINQISCEQHSAAPIRMVLQSGQFTRCPDKQLERSRQSAEEQVQTSQFPGGVWCRMHQSRDRYGRATALGESQETGALASLSVTVNTSDGILRGF